MWRLMWALCILAACSRGEEADEREAPRRVDLRGSWRAVLSSPGGPLPFRLRIDGTDETPPAVVENAGEETPVAELEVRGREAVLSFGAKDARIEAEAAADGARMSGSYRRMTPEGEMSLPFTAVRGARHRFDVTSDHRAAFADVTGRWEVVLEDEQGTREGGLELEQEEKRVTGRFLRAGLGGGALEGSFAGGLLRLSRFDGTNAILVRGRAKSGGTLAGDLWSRGDDHALWRAERAGEGGR